jgi:hypothetical protein
MARRWYDRSDGARKALRGTLSLAGEQGHADSLARTTTDSTPPVRLDTVPINQEADYDAATGWLGAAEVGVATMNEFRRQVEHRARETNVPSTRVRRA